MKKYLGVKIVEAEPMDEFTFKRSKDVEPLDNDLNREGYKVVYEDGYVSWSPKEIFEEVYREIQVSERPGLYNVAQDTNQQSDSDIELRKRCVETAIEDLRINGSGDIFTIASNIFKWIKTGVISLSEDQNISNELVKKLSKTLSDEEAIKYIQDINKKIHPFSASNPEWTGAINVPLNELTGKSIDEIESKGYSPEYVTVNGLKYPMPESLRFGNYMVEFDIPRDIYKETKWTSINAAIAVNFKYPINDLIRKYSVIKP